MTKSAKEKTLNKGAVKHNHSVPVTLVGSFKNIITVPAIKAGGNKKETKK